MRTKELKLIIKESLLQSFFDAITGTRRQKKDLARSDSSLGGYGGYGGYGGGFDYYTDHGQYYHLNDPEREELLDLMDDENDDTDDDGDGD